MEAVRAGACTVERGELKRAILELLREDEEFRLAVAGAIGLGEVLEEFRRLRSDVKALYEKMVDHDKRFEVLEKKMFEHDKRFEVIERKLLEHDRRFEAIERKLLEHDEKFRKVIEEIKMLNRSVAHVEDGLGALTEATLSWFVFNDIRGMLEEGERVEARIRNARVDEEVIDLLVVTDRRVFVVEVKVRPKRGDVGALVSKGDVVSRRYPGRRVELILASSRVGREVAEYARDKGVVVIAY
jgi:hypothetical protein